MSESAWAPTPGVESVANIQKQAAGYCLYPTDPEALERALMGIHRAVDALNTRLWSWTITYDDIYFVAGQSEYALASWFSAPSHMDVWDAAYANVWNMKYLPWKEFLTRYPSPSLQHTPTAYSCSNVHSMGSISLSGVPTAEWVALNPNARLWYYRRVHYPVTGQTLDVPSEVSAYIQYWADGYTADSYAPGKAQAAYARAREHWDLLIRAESRGQSDWEF